MVNKLKLIIAVYAILAVVFQGCKWKHNGKVVKDKDGNLYILEANGIRNESYDLQQLPKDDIDSILNDRQLKHTLSKQTKP